MYTTQVDLYEIIKRFSEPARTPETLIFVIYLRFRPARVLTICGRFRGPSSGPPGRFLGPPNRPKKAKTRAGRKRKYTTKIRVLGVLAGSEKRLIIS